MITFNGTVVVGAASVGIGATVLAVTSFGNVEVVVGGTHGVV
jgi:hypothetical protein